MKLINIALWGGGLVHVNPETVVAVTSPTDNGAAGYTRMLYVQGAEFCILDSEENRRAIFAQSRT